LREVIVTELTFENGNIARHSLRSAPIASSGIAKRQASELYAGTVSNGKVLNQKAAIAAAQAAPADTRDSLTICGQERWYLVHTLPKKELQARMHLRVQGFRTFVPQYLRTVRHARKLRTERAPLFPSYLFVILDLGRDRWLSVRSTIGVSYLVGSRENHPIAVPHGVVEALIQQTDAFNLMTFSDKLEKGQKVRVASGPFADLVGTLDSLNDSGRVRLLLNMMGSEILITLPRAGILPAA
jgi:transcription elongation factor/antiterminator RfaH